METTKIKSTAPDKPVDLVARIFVILLGLLPVIAVYAPKGMVLLVGTAAVALLFDQGVRKDLRATPLPPILVVSLPLIVWSLIAVNWSPSPAKALRLWGSIMLLLAAARILNAGVAQISDSDRHRMKSALILSAGLFIVLVGIENITEGFIVKILKGTRGKGIDDYKAWLAPGNTIMAVCAWPMIGAVASRTNIYVGATMFAAITILTVFGFSDAAVLAMVVSGLVLALVLWGKRWALAGIAALSFVGAVATPFLIQAIRWSGIREIFGVKSSFPVTPSHRWVIWKFTSSRIMDHPFRGWGFNSSRSIPGSSGHAYGQQYAEMLPLHPHNGSLQIWLELGLVGALAFALIIAAAPYQARRISNNWRETAILMGVVAAYMTLGQLSFGVWQNWWIATMILAITLARLSVGTEAIKPDHTNTASLYHG